MTLIIRKDRAGLGICLCGVIILHHKDYIKIDCRQDLELPGLECIWVKIRTKPQQTLLNISYRSPLFTDRNYWTLFNQSIGLANDISPNLLIVGDLNIDFLSRTPFNVNYVLSVNGLVNVIHEPTHFTVLLYKSLILYIG